MGRYRSKNRMFALLLTVAVAVFGLVAPAAHATSRPPAPTNLEVTDVGWRYVELSWEAPQFDLDSSWWYEITNVTTGQREYAGHWQTSDRPPFPSLQPDTKYTFEITLVNFSEDLRSAPSNRATATTLPLPHVEPPTDFQATDVFARSVYLSWQAPSDDPDLRYRVTNLTTGSTVGGWLNPEPSTVVRQRPGVTNSYEVVAIHEPSGAISEPSNRITVTTPNVQPPDDVEAVRDGNDVTLTWTRPDVADPAGRTTYWVSDNDRLVATNGMVTAREDGTYEITFPRLPSGTTRSYTVEVRYGASWPFDTAESDPVTVAVPPSEDITPPTAPAAVAVTDYDTGTTSFRITEQSVDDTTLQSEINYEAVSRNGYDDDNQVIWLAYDFDVPIEFDNSAGPVSFPTWIRAVDEAGNRSPVVMVESVIED